MKRWKLILTLALALTTLIVVLQNTEPVETRLLFTSVTMPRALLLGITLLVGLVCGLVLSARLERRSPKPAGKAPAATKPTEPPARS